MVDSYNGCAMIGMTGKNCVAIATDSRLGIQYKTISTDFQKVFKVHDHCLLGNSLILSFNSIFLLGLAGLATDIQTVSSLFHFRTNMYKLTENEEMKPSTFVNLVATTLYEKR